MSARRSNKHSSHTTLTNQELLDGCRLGIDSHADMSCVGRHGRIMDVFHGSLSNVQPFHDSYKPMTGIRTVNAAFAHDTEDGRTFILNLNQCLDFSEGGMEHSLLCPNQARVNEVIVDDIPLHLDHNKLSTHSITFPKESIKLPLSLQGPISYLSVRYPTDYDLDEFPHLDLTSDLDWDPDSLQGIERGISSINAGTFDSTLYHVVNALKHSVRSDVSPEDLSSLWGISMEDAIRTLKATTHDSLRILEGKINRRVRTKAHQRLYNQLSGYNGMFASDTFKANVTSLRGNLYTQHFCNRANYAASYPIKLKSHAYHALDRFLHEVGIPCEMLTDGAQELYKAEWGRTCRKHKIQQRLTEPHSPWQNPAELSGGIIKRRVRQLMRTTNTPVRLWDYCWEYATALRCLTATHHINLDNVTPFEKIHGYTPNIPEYLVFKWYEWIWYHDPPTPEKTRIGRWLGPAHSAGQGLAYHILTQDGKVVTRSTVSKISPNEKSSPEITTRQEEFTKIMESKIGNFSQATIDNTENSTDKPYDHLFEDDNMDDEEVEFQEVDNEGNPVGVPDSDHTMAEDTDEYIGMSIPLPKDGELSQGIVKSRKRNATGDLVGTKTDNPITDSRIYEVEFKDGSSQEYATNTLVENLYAHVDDDGRSHSILAAIVDHRSNDEAITPEEGTYTTSYGVTKKIITTKGWQLKVEWKDGTSSWIPLKDIKESNPLDVSEYARARKIIHQPAFAWWCPHVLRKKDRIIKQVQHRLIKKNLKFGIKVPSSVEEALAFDQENGNDLWAKSIEKELKNVRVAFKPLDEGERPPPGSKKIPYHIIFDVKYDLTRKSRCVAGGHRNKDVPAHASFSSVASRDSVRLTLLIAALNDLDVLSADIGNAYLNAPCRERVYVECGPELFGEEYKGRLAVIVRALYGLKSAGAAWRYHFSQYIENELGYKSTISDPDVYRKPMLKADGSKYYSYLVVYVDDILCIHEHPKQVLDVIEQTFRLKDGAEIPKLYLGTDVKKWTCENADGTNKQCWATGSNSYIKEAIKVAELHIKNHGLSPTSTRKIGRNTPFNTCDYRPELETSALCDGELTTVYQNLIGILRWTCELGRIDILHEVSLLSQYLAQPRIGHLTQVVNIFFYLKNHDRSWMVLDPGRFEVEWTPRNGTDIDPKLRAESLREIYTDACDELPSNMPTPRGKPIDISVFVDADHAGNKVTRRSHTGIIIYCNLSPIIWYSKRQNTVESSTFGSEFIALRIATELVESLRYKLRMFGVPIEGPARVFCDNESVVKSSSYAESTLKKKHCSIAYHRVREAIAAGKLLVYYESTSTNLADLLTKPLPYSKRKGLVQAILS
jgi:hypothetical protein